MMKITSEVINKTFFGSSGKKNLINNKQANLEILDTIKLGSYISMFNTFTRMKILILGKEKGVRYF